LRRFENVPDYIQFLNDLLNSFEKWIYFYDETTIIARILYFVAQQGFKFRGIAGGKQFMYWFVKVSRWLMFFYLYLLIRTCYTFIFTYWMNRWF
jgi:hypothetical protein